MELLDLMFLGACALLGGSVRWSPEDADEDGSFPLTGPDEQQINVRARYCARGVECSLRKETVMNRAEIKAVIARQATEDAMNLMTSLEQRGFTPSYALCVLCAAITAIAIRQDCRYLASLSVDDVGGIAITSRINEIQNESGGKDAGEEAAGEARLDS